MEESAETRPTILRSAQLFHYPKSVLFILFYEFGEKTAVTLIKSTLPVYLYYYFGFSKGDTNACYHLFLAFLYLNCFVGAIIADSFIGKYNLIVCTSMMYFCGISCLILSAAPFLKLPALHFAILGLILCAIACGMIKPCVPSFGGDQYKTPEQAKQLEVFFITFFVVTHLGVFFGYFLAPLTREDVTCFQDKCYMFTFGVSLIFISIATVVFGIGCNDLSSAPIEWNVFQQALRTIRFALQMRSEQKSMSPRSHWLDYADISYDPQFIQEVKTLLRLLVLFTPIPLFFAVYDQQGSRFVFQAAAMKTRVGAGEFRVEHMMLLHPLLVLIFVPLCHVVLYPLLAMMRIRNILQRITIGGLFTAFSFMIAAIVEASLDQTNLPIPKVGITHFRMFNGFPNCSYLVSTHLPGQKHINLRPLGDCQDLKMKVPKAGKFEIVLYPTRKGCQPNEFSNLNMKSKGARSYFITSRGGDVSLEVYDDLLHKPIGNKATLRILSTYLPGRKIVIRDASDESIVRYIGPTESLEAIDLEQSTNNVYLDGKKLLSLELRGGDVFALLLGGKEQNKTATKLVRMAPPNEVSILWLLPQLIFLTIGDTMVTVNGLYFTYATAPKSMKAICLACWYMFNAIGNLIIVVIIKLHMFPTRGYEYALFAILLFIGLILFAYLSYRYVANEKRELVKDAD